jgi:hypothetical protein
MVETYEFIIKMQVTDYDYQEELQAIIDELDRLSVQEPILG